MTSWSMRGPYMKNCNCDPGCPCDFNQAPTHGNCEGIFGMQVAGGDFGDVSLYGLHWVGVVHWPGRIDEGNGDVQWIVDERADASQRDALEEVLNGRHGGPLFEIVDMMCPTKHETLYARFDFTLDLDERRGHMRVGDVLETEVDALRGIDPPDPYRIIIQIPGGFEYTGEGNQADIAQAKRIRSDAAIRLDLTDSHSSVTEVAFDGERSVAAA